MDEMKSSFKDTKWLNIYQVRKILISRGFNIPPSTDFYELALDNGFSFDRDLCLWEEVEA